MTPSEPSHRVPGDFTILLGMSALPLVLFGALCGTWFLAWFLLGHPPQPYVDDPMQLHWAYGPIYVGAVVFVMFGFPVSWVLQGFALFVVTRKRFRFRISHVIGLFLWIVVPWLLWALLTGWNRDMGEWFFD